MYNKSTKKKRIHNLSHLSYKKHIFNIYLFNWEIPQIKPKCTSLIIIPVLLYGAGAWTMSAADETALLRFLDL